jgi:ferritin
MLINRYLSEEEIKQIQVAYFHEISNSIIYSNLAVWLNSKGLVNLSEYYQDWSKEENEHNKWVRDFMIKLDIPIGAGYSSVEDYNLDSDFHQFTNVTLQREDLTTKIYRDLMMSASDLVNLGDGMLMTFCLQMLSEQLEESDKALTLNVKINNIDDFNELMLFDNTFKS